MKVQGHVQKKSMTILAFVTLLSMLLTACVFGATAVKPTPTPKHTPTPTPTPTFTPTPTPDPTPTYPAVVPPNRVLGIAEDTQKSFKSIYDTGRMNDAAQAGADAVQCGNEQMKQGPFNSYVPPAVFAKFYDLCQKAMHAVRPEIPIIIGSNDPHVGGQDYYPLVAQADYLDSMQYYMNTSVHPGGHWNWRSQTIGLIDSWHNGYPDQSVNSLYGLYLFWAQQFGVDLGSGGLGKHLWVVEGTGCIFGCGIATDSYDVAVSHILTLITDVQTTMRYQVPFFYFSARDFPSQGAFWPMGIRSIGGNPKPIRQDLWMGARTLNMSCGSGHVTVSSQEQLLASLYSGCNLPGNYIGILES
ncbi:MAG: hypothetical protein AUG54_05230 [Ktedonobacter sp. 13_1_20CM_4_53_7]|nr:MAG: hypothetical protein AUG54_05230 [Ktedonobacter sp. 13_1_20CM_4_53_7]